MLVKGRPESKWQDKMDTRVKVEFSSGRLASRSLCTGWKTLCQEMHWRDVFNMDLSPGDRYIYVKVLQETDSGKTLEAGIGCIDTLHLVRQQDNKCDLSVGSIQLKVSKDLAHKKQLFIHT